MGEKNPHKLIATNLSGNWFRKRGGANWIMWFKKKTKLKCFKERCKWRCPRTKLLCKNFREDGGEWKINMGKGCVSNTSGQILSWSLLWCIWLNIFNFSSVMGQNRYLIETAQGNEAEFPLGKWNVQRDKHLNWSSRPQRAAST